MAISQAAQRIEQDPALARYSRQMLFEPIGEEGQRRLLAARVTLVGCGALGTVLANTLARAGVGFMRIIDRDFIESNNLQRQVLFDEDDIAANLPKAEAARRKLARINSGIELEAVVTDVNHRNIEQLGEGADLLLDGTDNFETRFLINDLAVKTKRPWVYGACIGATGLSMPILPDDTPCLRCIFEQAPPPEMNPTCDTAGVLGPVVNMVASHQALEAMKILMGRYDALNRRLLNFDAWSGRVSMLNVQKAYDKGECPCCKQRNFEYLEGRFGSSATTLCGRNAVQVTPPPGAKIDFASIADKVRRVAHAEPRFNAFMLKADIPPHELTVFADGRAIIKGTNKPEEARTIYAKYIGA
jgi:molybdopterin-synthase adenylyltransferase